ncbi:DNA polymerase eta-like [Belonocnema kinseyi]|uniref:DNA polymerase eta-like n=1 Tax=Belonocnema kinseyi TaxID=2817044 RepID=UPI00143D453D|nr:DNA polymerase eta-like [Belonocnema kinseyi]
MALFGERIVVLIDMDCFFCQVEARLQPEFKGKPLAVVQYNQWLLGGIIAVNYEAREFGVTRHMRGEEAKEKCPEIILASVPALRGKSDTSRYRNAGREVIDVLKKHCNKIERASVDEAYLDITQIVDDRMVATPASSDDLLEKLSNTYVVGYSECDENNEEERRKGLETWLSSSFDELDDIQSQKLAVAGTIVEELRSDVYETTGFRCSAGISYNKILAKLACGLHKPNKQTILPSSGVPILFKSLPVKKVKNLGGKLGDVVTDSLKCNVMSDLLRYSMQDLQNFFDEKTGSWLYYIARGIDNTPVTTRLVSKSIGVCKNFPGKQAIDNADLLKHWLGDLSAEVCERLEQDLEENERRATLLTVSFHFYQDKAMISQSKSCPLNSYKPEKVASLCYNAIIKATQRPIAFIGLSAGKFIQVKGSGLFRNYFTANANKEESKNNSSLMLEAKVSESLDTYSEFESNQKTKLDVNSEYLEHQNIDTPDRKSENFFRNYAPKSHSSFDAALDSENFKQSFFINILKENHVSADDKLIPKAEILETEIDNEDSENFDSNSNNIYAPETADVDHLECAENIDTPTSKNFKFSTPKKENVAEMKTSQFSAQISSSNWSAAEMNNVEAFVNINEKITVELHEIFPDPSDIDPGVISLLPPELQKEATELLRNSTKTNKKAAILAKHARLKKNNKVKSPEPGSSKGGNSIHSFLIKSSSSCETDETLKKCEKCHQLVHVEKILEHNDYHVAQELQKDLNKSTTDDAYSKRKQSFDSSVVTVKRRNTENFKSNTKSKSIASFFS